MKLYVSLPQGDSWGWGICGKNIIKELKRLEFQSNRPLILVDDPLEADVAFVCINDISLSPYPEVDYILWKNNPRIPIIGYCFFEEDLPDVALENAKQYDLILAGSTWCAKKLIEKGINHVDVLIQGIDPELFFKLPPKEEDGKFTIFSGGKFEYRKGQDIVLAAFKLLQDSYPNLHLLTNWYNHWDFSMDTMAKSEFIEYARTKDRFGKITTWNDTLKLICDMNGIDWKRVEDVGLIPNHEMRCIFARTDLGVFPNRCEGGTNLVLMEYMACGLPVLANQSTGQADLFEFGNPLIFEKPEELALMIESDIGMKNREWDRLGNLNYQRMQDFTWKATVQKLLYYLDMAVGKEVNTYDGF